MNKGVTLIELLVTMSIIAILSGILFLGKAREEERFVLQVATYNLMQNLREVQGMAMGAGEAKCNGTESYSFGIYFHPVLFPESYFLFADCNNNQLKDGSDKELREVSLEKDVKICSSPPSPLHVLFQPPEPTTFINGSEVGAEGVVTLCLKSDASEQRKVKVNTVGRIEIE